MTTNVTVFKNESLVRINEELQTLESEGKFHVPKDYSIKNALNSAWLKIVKTTDNKSVPVLTSCSDQSIKNALFDMVVQGLNPMKDQCYFIPYAGELAMMPSYFGKIASLKRIKAVEDIVAQVVYTDDVFEVAMKDGVKSIVNHEQPFGNADGVIVGAYAIVTYKDGKIHTETMTMKMIEAAWSMGKAQKSPARTQFPDQMAMRTVLNRAIKITIKSSNDQNLLIESIIKTNENESRDEPIEKQKIGLNFEEDKDSEPVVEVIVDEKDEPVKEVVIDGDTGEILDD